MAKAVAAVGAGVAVAAGDTADDADE